MRNLVKKMVTCVDPNPHCTPVEVLLPAEENLQRAVLQYHSERIREMMQSREKYSDLFEYHIECSKVHWCSVESRGAREIEKEEGSQLDEGPAGPITDEEKAEGVL